MSELVLRWVILVVVGLVTWQLSGRLVLHLYGLSRHGLCDLAPAARAWLLLAIAALPALVAVGVCVILFAAPDSLLAPMHCHDGHGCGVHAPVLGTTTLHLPGWTLASGFALATVATLALLAWLRRGHRRFLNWLTRGSDPRGFGVIDTDLPLAFTYGATVPAVYLSRGLVAAISPEQLAIILAHEQSHVARRDQLRLMIARFLLPSAGRASERLHRDLRIASGESADRACLAEHGDAATVAAALLAVERLGANPGRPDSADSADRDDIRLRLTTLLHPPHYRALQLPWLMAVAAFAAVMIALATQIAHYVIETAMALSGVGA